jgi:hypothetical protein
MNDNSTAKLLHQVSLVAHRCPPGRRRSLERLCGPDFGDLRIDAHFYQVEKTLSFFVRIDLRLTDAHETIASGVVHCRLEAMVEGDRVFTL